MTDLEPVADYLKLPLTMNDLEVLRKTFCDIKWRSKPENHEKETHEKALTDFHM